MDFCREFNIKNDNFRKSGLTWEALDKIASDFASKRDGHQDTLKRYAEDIQKCSYVHSLSYRVKDTKHLIEKIIRKNASYLEKGEAVSELNYETKITDLMGIRILLLFKEDWLQVHDYLMEHYRDIMAEEPFAYIRSGDDRSLYEGKIQIIEDRPYRSVHYVIRTDNGLGIEIQVRTLYEEAWSEIDHKLRYPYNLTNNILTSYINLINRLTGISDEMASFINSHIRNFQENLFSGVTSENEVYQYILDKIEGCSDETLKEEITNKIIQAENYHEMNKMADLLTDILQYN